MKRVILGSILLLSGCADPYHWEHYPEASHQQRMHDGSMCNARATQITGDMGGLMGYAMFASQRDMCLEGEGYVKVPGPKPS